MLIKENLQKSFKARDKRSEVTDIRIAYDGAGEIGVLNVIRR